jgi:signal transduction histidine kinase
VGGTYWYSRPEPGTDLDATLKRLVVGFRVLSWVWMTLLVATTIASDDGANLAVTVGAEVLATAWMITTVVVAYRTDQLGSWWFAALDGAVCLLIGAASTIAGAEDFFHGGYLLSWLMVAAYAGGTIAALAASGALFAEQVAIHVVEGKGTVPALGSVGFAIFAFVLGATVDSLRRTDRDRRIAVEALEREQAEAARMEERSRIADQIHDTVLQTLHAIQIQADDPTTTRYLARQQERELRKSIASLQSPHPHSFRVAMLSARDGVEAMYPVEIDAVVRYDTEMSPHLAILVDAAREAMLNAAAHSGVEQVELFSERTTDDSVVVHVKDRGRGFDPSRVETHKGIGRFVDRLAVVGGRLDIESEPGRGTECSMWVPLS